MAHLDVLIATYCIKFKRRKEIHFPIQPNAVSTLGCARKDNMMDEWISVEEDLPLVDKQYTGKQITVDVEYQKDDGTIGIGFYCYDINQWFKHNGNRIGNVLRWRSL